MHHQQLMLLCKFNDFLKKGAIDHLGCGVMRERQNQQFGKRPYQLDAALHFIEEVTTRKHRNTLNVATCNQHRIKMNRIGRIGDEGGVASSQKRQTPSELALLWLRL